jgi:hypothetical protein
MSLRDAVASLSTRGYRARLAGSGTVLEQIPPPGSPLAGDGVCALRLGRPEESAAVKTAKEPERKPLVAAARFPPRKRAR